MEDKLTNPDEKSSAGILSHDEKVAEAPPPELAEQTGRSKAVALNIVQNPLTVRFANFHLLIVHIHDGTTCSILTLFFGTAQLQRTSYRRCPSFRSVA
jgi:hypothetical protein